MILGEVEETVTTVEIDDETYEEIVKVTYAGTAPEHLGVKALSSSSYADQQAGDRLPLCAWRRRHPGVSTPALMTSTAGQTAQSTGQLACCTTAGTTVHVQCRCFLQMHTLN